MKNYEADLFFEVDTLQEQLYTAGEKEGFEVAINLNVFPAKVEFFATKRQLKGQAVLEGVYMESTEEGAVMTFELADTFKITMKSNFKIDERTLNKFKNRTKSLFKAYLVYNFCISLEKERAKENE